ncbi:MAG: putative Ig domain-containing protein [Melioribacteraceae bacterium]|nr:putative Ig domain-containing protein [Melioribacteraceae bacterium]
MIDAVIADRNGSVLLITHNADVTWGTISIEPLSGNFAPQFTSSPISNAQVDQAYLYNITTSDPNAGDVLTITAPTLPSWLTFNDNGNGSAALYGTPTSGNLGAHTVELIVDDGNGETAVQNFTITVTPDASSLPFSDQFCGPNIESYWTIYDPYDAGAGTQTGAINFRNK